MGSLGEEELVQMVQDFIESESSSSTMFPSFSNRQLPSFSHLTTQRSALQEILRSGSTEGEREVLEIVLKLLRSKKHKDIVQRSSTGLKKWLATTLKMNGFNACLCQTSWVTSLGCPGGDYEYIEIVMESRSRLIVDVDFKSQFELARPTPTYKELTDALPSIFVGSEEKLNKIISFLCSAAKQSFREAGLHVPPWRTTTYMQSKWLSSPCTRHNNNNNPNATNNNNNEGGFGREMMNKEVAVKTKSGGGAHSFGKWAPPTPMAKPTRRRADLGGGGGGGAPASALSTQFSDMGINCC